MVFPRYDIGLPKFGIKRIGAGLEIVNFLWPRPVQSAAIPMISFRAIQYLTPFRNPNGYITLRRTCRRLLV